MASKDQDSQSGNGFSNDRNDRGDGPASGPASARSDRRV